MAAVRGRARVLAPAALAVLLAALLVTGAGARGPVATGATPPVALACGPDWVTAWAASPVADPAGAALAGRTLRLVVHPRLTGDQVRLQLSNRFGTSPLVVGPITLAPAGPGGTLAGPARPVTVGGAAVAELPPGADVRSDPVPLDGPGPLAVSFGLPTVPPAVTIHPVALQTSYASLPGAAADPADPGVLGAPIVSWPVLTGLDVRTERRTDAVVVVGDSITDGVGSPPDSDMRWPDRLAQRLAERSGSAGMAVLNAGISANELLGDGTSGGPAPLERFGSDVTGRAGVTDVVLHVGTNDIRAGRDAPSIVAGLVRYANLARAAGTRVFLTTLTPSETGAHGTPQAIATRDAVNAWIRAAGPAHADGVFDLAAAVADPARPSRLAPAADSGDGLHLSPAGYVALARAVDVDRLSGSPSLGAPAAPPAVRADG